MVLGRSAQSLSHLFQVGFDRDTGPHGGHLFPAVTLWSLVMARYLPTSGKCGGVCSVWFMLRGCV